MGAIRLGVLATFMSDPMISGFTTGSAVLVVISQMPHIFGLTVPPMSSPLTAPKVNIDLVSRPFTITPITCTCQIFQFQNMYNYFYSGTMIKKIFLQILKVCLPNTLLAKL